MNFWSFVVENRGEIAQLTLEHLWIVGISTMLAVAVGIPLGILITQKPALRRISENSLLLKPYWKKGSVGRRESYR